MAASNTCAACASGTFLNSAVSPPRCDPCSAPCANCVDNPTKCTTCQTGYGYNSATFACATCGTTTFLNLALAVPTCDSCAAPCTTCVTTANTCTACLTNYGFFAATSTCATCTAGTFLNTTVAVPTCDPCTSPCATCSGTATQCSTCVAGYGYFAATQTCQQCTVAGTFLNAAVSPPTCDACSAPCGNCTDNPTKCTTCQTGYGYNSATFACATCSTPGTYLNLNKTVPTCDTCDPNCATCSVASTTCLTCPSSSHLYPANSTCSPCTQAGWFANLASTPVSTCDACAANCATCTTTASTCTSCRTATDPYLNQSSASCGPCTTAGWFQDLADPVLPLCSLCDPNCATCSTTSTNCTTCQADSYLNLSARVCSACTADGWFQNLAAPVPTCDTCDPNCATCSVTSTNCTTCPVGSYLNLSDHTCSPCTQAGWFANLASTPVPTCDRCHSNCANCSTTAANCTSCPSGQAYQAANHTCFACVAQGFFLNTTVPLPTCDGCDANCKSCLGSPKNCSACPAGLSLSPSHICERGISFTLVGGDYNLSSRPADKPDVLVAFAVQAAEVDVPDFTPAVYAQLTAQMKIDIGFEAVQSGAAETLLHTKKFGYVIDNIYSMFIYVTGIPNEQKYNVRFSVGSPQNITINGTYFMLQPFSYNATYATGFDPGELKSAAATGQMASAFMGQVPIKSDASTEIIGMAASADPTGVITRFSQILKISSKLLYINIKYGRKLTAFLESTEAFAGSLKEPSTEPLVRKSTGTAAASRRRRSSSSSRRPNSTGRSPPTSCPLQCRSGVPSRYKHESSIHSTPSSFCTTSPRSTSSPTT